MPYGKDAKEELNKLCEGKCLRVIVYDQDRYGRCVGDIYCNGKFVQVVPLTRSLPYLSMLTMLNNHLSNLLLHYFNQEIMLKKGFAWHYAAYDKRSELAKVSFIIFASLSIFKFC